MELAWQSLISNTTDPAALMFGLLLGTLIVEDLAAAAGVALATQGMLSWTQSFIAVAGGITVGDWALYGLGFAARKLPRLEQRYLASRVRHLEHTVSRNLMTAIFLARVMPGMRLPTYTYCGFVRSPLPVFLGWVSVAVAMWTLLLYVGSATIGQTLTAALGLPLAVTSALPIIALALLAPAWRLLRATSNAPGAP